MRINIRQFTTTHSCDQNNRQPYRAIICIPLVAVVLFAASCSRVEVKPQLPATSQMMQTLLQQDEVQAIKLGSSWRTYGPYDRLEGYPMYDLPPNASRFASVTYQEEARLPVIGLTHIIMEYDDTVSSQLAFEYTREKNIYNEIHPEKSVSLLTLADAPTLAADTIEFHCEMWKEVTEDRHPCAARLRYGRYFTQIIVDITATNLRFSTKDEFYQLLQVVDAKMVELSQQ